MTLSRLGITASIAQIVDWLKLEGAGVGAREKIPLLATVIAEVIRFVGFRPALTHGKWSSWRLGGSAET